MNQNEKLLTTMLANYRYNCALVKENINKLSFLQRLNLFYYKKTRFFDDVTSLEVKPINSVAVIACYPRSDNYLNILQHLSKDCSKVILVYTNNSEYNFNKQYIVEKYPDIIILEVDNTGFDAGKYYNGIKYIVENNIDFDRILLINDSVKFLRPIDDFFAYQQLYHTHYNFIGLNNSLEIKVHFQSYFLSMDKKIALEYLKYYVNNIDKCKEFGNIVFYFEVMFSDLIINDPKYNSDCFYYVTEVCNPSYNYQLMGANYKYPLFKTKNNADDNLLLKYY